MPANTKRSFTTIILGFLPKSDFARLFLLFFLSHFFILFNRSVGWDGYSVLNGTYQELLNGFRAEGHPDLFPAMLYWLKTLTPYPILVFNCAIFICSFLSTYLSFLILKKIDLFRRGDALILSLLIATIPYLFFNLIGLSAILYYTLFLLALYFLILYKDKGVVVFRVLALVTFFISFYFNSHISFYILALLVLYYYWPKPVRLSRFIIKNIDFILLPVIFVIAKKISVDLYTGAKITDYNAISLSSFKLLPLYLLYAVQHSFIELFEISFDLLSKFYSVFIFLLLLPFIYLLLNDTEIDHSEQRVTLWPGRSISRSLFLFLLGAFIFLLGAFPFSLVAKYPHFNERGVADLHQCNLFLGAALMLYALVLSFIGKKWQRGVFALLLSCFVVASFNNFLLQNKLWLKTESLAINFRENEAIRNGRSFLVDDFADHLNTSYIIQGYTLNQLMKSSFNNEQTRFAITRIELQELYNEKKDYKKVVAHFTSIGQFSMKDYKLADFDYNLIIGEGDVVLTDLYSLKLLFYSYFNRQKFEEKVKPVISVKLSPCTGCPKLTE